MLLNIATHNVSMRNVKVSKRERHITNSVTKCTASQNVKCTLHKRHKKYTFCDALLYVTFTFWKLYVLELLHCAQLRFVKLCHVTFTLCCFTLCSNIVSFPPCYSQLCLGISISLTQPHTVSWVQLQRIRCSLVRMRSSLVVRASDCQCTSCNGPGFDPSIRQHSGIWGAADEAVLVRKVISKSNKVRKKYKKIPPNIFLKKWVTSLYKGKRMI